MIPALSRLLTVCISFWRTLVHKRRLDSDLDAELRSYADLLADEKMRAGMTAGAARRAALLDVGSVEQVKEQVRDARIGALLDTIVQDVRYGVRTLSRTPGFAAAAVLALALGIGANTAILSVVNAVLLRPLAYRESDRLTVLLHDGDDPVAPANFLDWRRESRAFERMGAAEFSTPHLTGTDEPEKVQGLRVTSDMFPMLGVEPLLGRVFTPRADDREALHEVVLSHGLWQRRFAGDPRIIGRTIGLGGQPHVVVGVMPRGFAFAPFWATRSELWMPMAFGDRLTDRNGSSLRVFARLKDGVTLEQARSEMAGITARLEREFPGTNRNVTVASLKEKVVGDIRPALLVLLGAVGFVLLIACANVAHMLLARSAGRYREVALRTALGASRSRMVRQFLTESIVLALAGGAAGVLLAMWSIRVLVWMSPAGLPRAETIGIDARVLSITLLICLVTGVTFGLAPALRVSRRDLNESLREGERGSTEGAGRHRLRGLLVASEIALALVLLVGAGLMVRTFVALRAIDPGFDARNLLTMVVTIAGTPEAEPGRRSLFYQQLLERVGAVPGVRAAGAINHLPLAGDNWGTRFWVEGTPMPAPGERERAVYRVVLPGYFRTMGIAVVRGRDVGSADDRDAPAVVVVNERLARRFWPGQDPIGRRLTVDDPRETPSWLTVVGVVEDTKQDEWAASPGDEIYIPYLQDSGYLEDPGPHVAYLTLVVRTTDDPASVAPAIRGAVRALSANAPLSEVQTMERVVAESTAAPRFYVLLFGTFAAVALLLAAVGIYGVMSYSVSNRTHEIGIRMALGARPADVVRLVVRQGMGVALVGAAVGLGGAFALTRLLSDLLYGVRSTDPATFLAVSVLLSTVAFAASYIPARRATRIDPLLALRHD